MSFLVFYIDLKQLEGEPARKVRWGAARGRELERCGIGERGRWSRQVVKIIFVAI